MNAYIDFANTILFVCPISFIIIYLYQLFRLMYVVNGLMESKYFMIIFIIIIYNKIITRCGSVPLEIRINNAQYIVLSTIDAAVFNTV